MVNKSEEYQIRCACCNKVLVIGRHIYFDNEKEAYMAAEVEDWNQIDGQFYCPDCIELNEKTGMYEPKNSTKR